MIVLTAVVAAAALLLVWTGVEHLREPAVLGKGRARGRGAAVALGAGEAVVGLAGLAALLGVLPDGRGALGVMALSYLGFGGYLMVRYRRGDRADCGCSRVASRVGLAGVARAAGLAVCVALAGVAHPYVVIDASAGAGALTLTVGASAVLTVVLYALPACVDGLASGRST